MKKFLLSIFAVLFAFAGVQAQETVTDKLVATSFAATSTTYANFTDVKFDSEAVYAGNSSKSTGGGIQLRSDKSNSGIVTTKSGGKAKKIVVEWQGNTTSGRTLDVYGKNSAYTNATDLYSITNRGTKIGSIVKGTSTELEINGDYEYIGLRSNSGAMYLTSISITWEASADVTPVAPAAPVLTEAQTFKGSMFVTITSDATVYYTTDGTTPSATNGTEYTDPFEITETTTVKAVAVNEVGESEVVYATYTKVELTEGCYVKVTSALADWSGKYLIVYEDGADAYVFSGVDAVNGYVAAEITDGVIVANSEIDAVAVEIATMENGYSIECVNGYIYGTDGQNKLNFNATTAQLNTIELAEDGVEITSGGVFCFNADSNQKRFRYYGKTAQKPVQLYKYTEPVEESWSSFYAAFPVAIPEGVEAYIVTAANAGYVTLTQIYNAVPANTGVILKGGRIEASTDNYYSGAVTEVTGNLLLGTMNNTYIEEEAYVLGCIDGEYGLYKALMTDGKWLNNANKAYLPASAVANKSAEFFGFDWDGTTAIENVEVENASNVIYDLTGRKVEAITAPGIYIVGGKKVLVK